MRLGERGSLSQFLISNHSSPQVFFPCSKCKISHLVYSISPSAWHFASLDSLLSPPAFFIFPPHSLPLSISSSQVCFLVVAVSDMAMEHNGETMLPTAWRGEHSHYNSADVYCCWQSRARCIVHTRTHAAHAHGRTHIFNWCTRTQKDVYVSRPWIRTAVWLQVYSCVFPSWVEPTFHMPPSPNCHAGIWPVFSAYRETASFF